MREGVLLWGLLYVIIALLPKDGAAFGRERPVGLLPIIVRILDRLFYGELSAWCDSAHGFWDRAIASCSAHVQPSMMETAHIMGISAAFFSSTFRNSTTVLTWFCPSKRCSVLEYPRIPLLMLLQAFSGPLTLRDDGHHREQIPVSHGLVAGCSQDNHLARALLHRALHDHHHRRLKLAVWQFVDDLKMYTEGTTRQVVFRLTQPAVELFHSLGKLKSRSVSLKCGFVAFGRMRALVLPEPDMREIWVLTSLLVAVQFPLRGKEQNAHLLEQDAFEALPRNMLVPVASCSKEELDLRACMVTRFGAFYPHP